MYAYCSTRGHLGIEATATVLVGATRMAKCFQCERDFADRYGSTDIHPFPRRESPFMRRARLGQLPTKDLTF